METIRSLSEKLMIANERCDEKDKQIEAISLSVKDLSGQLASSRSGHQRLVDKFKAQGLQLAEAKEIIKDMPTYAWTERRAKFLREAK